MEPNQFEAANRSSGDECPLSDKTCRHDLRAKNGSLFAAVSSGMAICPSRVMVLSEVTVIVFVRAS